jgi:hypothetical protein
MQTRVVQACAFAAAVALGLSGLTRRNERFNLAAVSFEGWPFNKESAPIYRDEKN